MEVIVSFLIIVEKDCLELHSISFLHDLHMLLSEVIFWSVNVWFCHHVVTSSSCHLNAQNKGQ